MYLCLSCFRPIVVTSPPPLAPTPLLNPNSHDKAPFSTQGLYGPHIASPGDDSRSTTGAKENLLIELLAADSAKVPNSTSQPPKDSNGPPFVGKPPNAGYSRTNNGQDIAVPTVTDSIGDPNRAPSSPVIAKDDRLDDMTRPQVANTSPNIQNPDAISPTVATGAYQTTSLPSPHSPLPRLITVAGKIVTGNAASQYIIGSQTLTAGAPGITIDGTPVSLQPLATALVIGSSTKPLPGSQTQDTITLGSLGFARGPGSDLAIGTQTITPGAPAVTVSGTPISLAVSGSAVVIGDSTFPVFTPTSKPVVLEINGTSFTETSGSEFVVGSQTLLPGGPAITINGTVVSLAPAATGVVVGSQTAALVTSQATGDIIVSASFSGGPGPLQATSGTTPEGFTGGSPETGKGQFDSVLAGIMLLSWLVLIFI
ncbi:MAG: hypothetical protein Q9201_001308 [Fulgogasparrea decipioides]